jgi:hypothetical protein
MAHIMNKIIRAAVLAGIALGMGLIGRTVWAVENETTATTTVIRRHGKTIQDSMGTTIASPRGSLGSKVKPSDRSFSSAAYREKASAELRAMQEAAAKAQSETNAPVSVKGENVPLASGQHP